MRRPCGLGHSLGQPIVRSISHLFWSAPKKLSHLRDKTIFLSSLDNREWPIFKKDWTKNSREWTKKIVQSLRWDNFLLADQKKWEIDRTIGRPKGLTKTTWTLLAYIVILKICQCCRHKNGRVNFTVFFIFQTSLLISGGANGYANGEEVAELGCPQCPRINETPLIEPLVCKKIAHERLTALVFREDCLVTACQDGYVCTWARPGKVVSLFLRKSSPTWKSAEKLLKQKLCKKHCFNYEQTLRDPCETLGQVDFRLTCTFWRIFLNWLCYLKLLTYINLCFRFSRIRRTWWLLEFFWIHPTNTRLMLAISTNF